jgi:hypothetical protein
MDHSVQMFTTDSVTAMSSGKIVAQTGKFEQTSMTDDNPGVELVGDEKVELVYKNRITNEEASIDLVNSNNSSNNAKIHVDNPRGTTCLIIDKNRRLGVGNINPSAILHLHNHNDTNSEHLRITNNDTLGLNLVLSTSNTDVKAIFGTRWYNSGTTTTVSNALVIRNLNGTNSVGIGTSSPSYTLDVSGNINFTGTLTQNGSTFGSPYNLPIASSSTLGGIKVGNNLSINGAGVLSATDTNTTYSVGDGGLTQNNFTDSLKTKLDGIDTGANDYSLPAATTTSLGGIKVGTNLSINSSTGVLSATDTNTTYSVGDGGLTQNNFTNALKTKLDSLSNYTLPTASTTTLGGVKVDGSTITIDSNGIITSNSTYTLPNASSTTLGGIKVGTNLSINGAGVLSATDTNTTYSVGDGGLTQNNFTNTLKTKLDGISTSANNYSLPIASTSSLGGIKVGTNLSINSSTGVLSATDTNTTYSVGDGGLTQNNFTNVLKTKLDSLNNYSLPTSSTSTLGGVKVDGSTITINGSGVITSTSSYSLPIASTSSLGGIKVGTNLSINSSTGVLSATDTNTTYSVGDGGLTQNNFTNALKTKLSGIATSANNYSLPIAGVSTLGGIKVGTNLSIDSSTGVLSSTDTNTTYSVGDGGLTQNNFTDALKTKLNGIATSANNYSLPNASASSLGGIKVGTNLSIDGNGVLSATDTNTTYSVGDGGLTQNNFTDALKTKLDGIATSANNYSLPTSSTSTLGGVKVDGSTITINGSGVISSGGGGGSYTLPTASSSTLGGIKVGTGLSIDSSTSVLSTNQWTTSGSDIYRSSGNVGIGTTSFVDSRNTGGLHITNEKGISFKANTSQTNSRNWRIRPDDLGDWGSLGFCVSDSNSTTPGASADQGDVAMILMRNKKVGIGTTNPSDYLTVRHGTSSGSTYRGISLEENDGTVRWRTALTGANGSNHCYQYMVNSSGTITVQIHADSNSFFNGGRVGIGTTGPSCPLHVVGGVTQVSTDAARFFGVSSTSLGYDTDIGTDTIGIFATKGILTSTFFLSTSDRRIKKEIEDVPDNLSLETLRNIPVRYYKYKDPNKGEEKVIGFIAQEVDSVLPIAVIKRKDIPPSEMRVLENFTWEEIVETHVITVTETNPETGIETNVEKSVEKITFRLMDDLDSTKKYRFYVSDDLQVYKIVDTNCIFDKKWNNIYVYGEEVDDFHTIDKQKLFTINFSATQEIDRVQQQELIKVKDLEIENFLLKERVKDLESKMNDVLNRLAQLENN